jgi:molecular chaperone DnaK (HSP70)
MALIADPIFYNTIRRNSGGKRRIIHVTNTDPVDLELVVADVEKPEWIEIEGVYATSEFKLEKGKRTPFIVNVNTQHQYFPTTQCMDQKVRVSFEDNRVLDIAITLHEVIDKILPFRGVFAVDFGTSNSVYAYKGRAMDLPQHAKASNSAIASDEIPSAIFFHNVADPRYPRFSIGREAFFDIKEHSGQTYSYLLSSKRLLGRDKKLLILDRLGGAKSEHRQEYHVEEVAAFIMRELVERAQDEIGQKIEAIVATYPPLFTRGQKQALQRAIGKAMEALEIQIDPETLVMDLDEANAGAFNHIYGPMLDDFRNFQVTERKVDLLSLDFGGGTVDISLVSVDINRSQQGRISIETVLHGLSGDPNWGGDNVTLDSFKMLKTGLALAAAKARSEALEAKASAAPDPMAAAAQSDEDDIWGGGGGLDAGSIWGDDGEGEGAEGEKKEEEEDEETREIVNREPEADYEAALLLLAREEAIVQKYVSKNMPMLDVVVEFEKGDGSFSGNDAAAQRARMIESAIEAVLPTKFADYEDVDPFKMELARALFHEVWHEADLLKIRMSSAQSGKSKVSGVLKKCAKYAGVDAMVFNDIEFSIEELNARIGDKVDDIVSKAAQLYENAQGEGEGGDGLTLLVGGQQAERPPLRVLLLGNCSNLPLVQSKVTAAFGGDDQSVVFNSNNLKKAVACGAAEEYALRKEFGQRGLITYSPKGFLDSLPYSLGIMHRDLALMGYPNGFCPIFHRGAQVGATNVLDEESAFLIHEKMRDLAIFADYRDGAEPVYVGWIDFAEASTDVPSGPPPSTQQTIVGEGMPQEGALAQPDGEVPAGAPFSVKFELLGDRDIVATNLRGRTKHRLKLEMENWDPQRDPFSGVH